MIRGRRWFVPVVAALVAACGGGGESQQDVGAGIQDIAAEGQPTAQSQESSSSGQPPAGGEQGAGVYERGGDIEVVRGQQSFIGQDVIIRGTIAQLVVGNRAFMVMPESTSGGSGGQSGGSQGGGGSQQGGGEQGGQSQQGGGEQGGQQSQGGSQSSSGQADCFAQPGTCLLVVLDPRIDAGEIELKQQAQVELAGSVVKFEPSAVEETLRGETGGFDFAQYPGEAFIIVRILEVQTTPPSGGGSGSGH